MPQATLLIAALLFGGMTLYSFGFAAFVFKSLPPETAGPLIRKAFPHFDLFVLGTSLIAAILAVILAVIAATTLFARQILMPAINEATDKGDRARFKTLHTISVALTLSHIIAVAYVIVRLGSP